MAEGCENCGSDGIHEWPHGVGRKTTSWDETGLSNNGVLVLLGWGIAIAGMWRFEIVIAGGRHMHDIGSARPAPAEMGLGR